MAFKVIEKEKPISQDEVLNKVFDNLQARRRADLLSAENDTASFKGIHKERMSGDNLKGKGGAKWRRVARIHPLVYQAALKLYGPNVFKDKEAFRDLMKRPEMEVFLTVPVTEI